MILGAYLTGKAIAALCHLVAWAIVIMLGVCVAIGAALVFLAVWTVRGVTNPHSRRNHA